MRWLFVRNFGLRRFLKLIKLSVFLLLVSMHLAVADVGGQAKITIGAGTVTYWELFNQIKKQTGLTVVYSNNELDKHRTVEAGFIESDLRTVLDKILTGTRLTYGGNGNCKGIELRYGNGPGGTIPVKYTGD